jgi:uncharacterized protein (TIGR00375 family)
MLYKADLHIHSHYSRATSKDINLESLYQWAQVKGINIVGTGDFTHPLWFKELKEKLEPDGNGFFRLKNPPRLPALPGMKVHDIDVRFCLTTEISSIYKYGDKVRKNHNLVYAPDFDTVARINAKLSAIGNLASDGRPILGLPSRDLLEIVLEADPQAYLVPAHVWTPWFSTLGSRGGYDSIDECFRDLSDKIFAIETGLSSDPAMNWKWSALDRFTLISNSDAHSAQKLGREVNLFDTELSYEALFNALKSQKGFLGTYEFFPEEGKYHHDGHRNCGVSLEPKESLTYKNICPRCGQPLTIGVLHRIGKLVDREAPQQPKGAADFDYIIPLPEILSEIKGAGPASKTVTQAFHQAISTFGNEFSLLKEVPVEDILKQGGPVLAEAIRRMRTHEVKPIAGYDGLYGVIKIFNEGELSRITGQMYLLGGEDVKTMDKRAVTATDIQRFAENAAANKEKHAYTPIALNEAQSKVKETISGALLVKAGPGTGKTNTLIQWIGHQVNTGQAEPGEILAITFTNKAAKEIKDRLSHSLGEAVNNIRVGTFHSVAYRLLQEHDPALQNVYDEESRRAIISFLFPELKDGDHKKITDALADFFETGNHAGFNNINDYAIRYREYVRSQNAIDLSDLLRQLLDLWKKEPDILEKHRAELKTIAVDEFQDINLLQYEFVQLLGTGKNILAIGDPDQAIYGFRGADVKLFFRFAGDFQATQIGLTENYRSTPVILEAAGNLIQHNTLRSDVQLKATKRHGVKIKQYEASDTEQEAKYIIREIEKQVGGFHMLTGGDAHHAGNCAFSDIAVVYRTHTVGRELLTYLKKSGIPVHIADGAAFLSQPPFKLVADILRLYINPQDVVAQYNVLQHRKDFQLQLPDSLVDKSVEEIVSEIFIEYLPDHQLTDEQLVKKETILTLAKEATDIRSFLEEHTLTAYTDTGRGQAYGIHLLTFHAAKGLEFPVVFIAGSEEGITPSDRKDADLEEERRLFYVGLTRAKDELHITHAATRFIYGKEQKQQVSRFVNELPAELIEMVKPATRVKPKNKTEDQLSLF